MSESKLNKSGIILQNEVGQELIWISNFLISCFRHWLTNTYAVFGMPYFSYDTVAMYYTYIHTKPEVQIQPFLHRLQHFAVNSKAMLVHHLLLPLILFPSIIVSIVERWWYTVNSLLNVRNLYLRKITRSTLCGL